MYVLTVRYTNGVCEEISRLACCLPRVLGLSSDIPYRLIEDGCLCKESSNYSEELTSQIYST